MRRIREKTTYIEPPWKFPLSVQDLVLYPPQGYRFIAPEAAGERIFRFLSRYELSYRLHDFLKNFIPLLPLKSQLERFKSPPQECALTYSICHFVLRKEVWVLDMLTELPSVLVSGERHLEKYKERIINILSSDYCRGIICRAKKSEEAFLATFGEELKEKLEVVYWGVPSKHFEKQYSEDKVKILFVNSGNINTALHFYAKGGAEIIESFEILSRKYDDIELVIRSGMPKGLKQRYSRLRSIRIIDKPVSWTELEEEWKSADIFVMPNHVNTPAQVLLDAMSYELPVVTTDTWANPEFIENGKTGLLVHNPVAARFVEGAVFHLSDPAFLGEVMKGPNPEVVDGLVENLSILIENPKRRREMAKAGRWDIEHGKFSIKRRNERLKELLDKATA